MLTEKEPGKESKIYHIYPFSFSIWALKLAGRREQTFWEKTFVWIGMERWKGGKGNGDMSSTKYKICWHKKSIKEPFGTMNAHL